MNTIMRRVKQEISRMLSLSYWIQVMVYSLTTLLTLLILIGVYWYLITDFLPSPLTNTILPSSRLDIITVSLTLAGFTVSIWAAIEADVNKKSLYLNLAKKLVLAGVFLLIFHLLFILTQSLNVDPSKREYSLSGVGRFLVFYSAVVAIFVGTLVFSFSITDLLRLLIQDLIRVSPRRKLWIIRYRLCKLLSDYSVKIRRRINTYCNKSRKHIVDSLPESSEKPNKKQV
jgi:hypothetical protein